MLEQALKNAKVKSVTMLDIVIYVFINFQNPTIFGMILAEYRLKGQQMATAFQKSVWRALTLIPKGKVTSYGVIAEYLGTAAVRAVGTAVGKNPSAPQVPCHRVVLGSGKIGNYSGGEGVSTKISILQKEGIKVREGKVVNFKNIFWNY